MEDEELLLRIEKMIRKIIFETRYRYKSISPYEIIKAKMGNVNMAGFVTMNQRDLKVRKAIENRAIIENYTNEMSAQGWELVSDINYENLPYGGNLMFRRPIADGEVDLELVKDDTLKYEETGESSFEKKQRLRKEYLQGKKQAIKTVNLEAMYEEEMGKKAMYRGKETKGFMQFKKNYFREMAIKNAKEEDEALSSKDES